MSKSQAPAPQGVSQNTAVPSPPAASPATASTASAGPAVQTTDPSDVAALLKEVLMKISNEVPSTPPLTGKAADAVLQFQDISQDLRTLADRRGAGGSLKAPPAPRAAVR